MTTPKQPATEAERELIGEIVPALDAKRAEELLEIIKAEATAAAGLLALRDWAERSGHSDGCNYYMQFHENSGYVCDCGYDDLMKSTAPAAAEIEARIEQRLISRLVNDPTHIGVVSNETGDCYPLNSEAVEHLLLRERPATEEAGK